MESRKIQFNGRSTYIISLPKKWVEERMLKAGDRLLIETSDSGNLTMRAEARGDDDILIKSLEVTNLLPKEIERRVISCYLDGFDELKIISKVRILPEQREAILNILRRVLGAEILAETSNEVVVNDFLDMKDLPPKNVLRRMYVIVEFMLKNSVQAFFSRDKILANDVINRDEEVDKFYLLATREIIEGVKRKSGVEFDVPPEKVIHFLSIAKSLERIADHCVKISVIVKEEEWDISGELEKELEAFYILVFEKLELALKSFFKGDKKLADMTLNAKDEIHSTVSRILMKIEGKPDTLSVFTILDSFQRVYAYSTDIAECTLDIMT